MNFDEIKEKIMNPEDITAQFDAGDIESHKGECIASCFPILFWLPLAACKESPFGKFCANQGLITLILSVASGAVGTILGFIPFIGPIIGGLLSTILGLLSCATFLFTIINTSQGKAKVIPILGDMLNLIK